MKTQLCRQLSPVATVLALLIAFSGSADATVQTLTFDTPGATLDAGNSSIENGMKVTVINPATTFIGSPLTFATDPGLYFHGVGTTMTFEMVDGSNFDLMSFDLALNSNYRSLSTSVNPVYTVLSSTPT